MRLKFLILFTFVVCLPALAQRAGVTGVVVDAKNGEPVIGASVMLDNQILWKRPNFLLTFCQNHRKILILHWTKEVRSMH